MMARNLGNGDLGVCVASKFLGVEAVLPSAMAGVGAIARQSWINGLFASTGLKKPQGRIGARKPVQALLIYALTNKRIRVAVAR